MPVFEDEFMDAQASLVSLAMELLEDAPEKPDKVYIYIYRDDMMSFYNTFFSKGKKTATLDDYFPHEKIVEYFDIASDDIDSIGEVCERYSKPCPNEFRLIYDINTHSFDSDYSYEEINEDEKSLENIFDEWIAECENKLK